jgi:peroxiredoxin
MAASNRRLQSIIVFLLAIVMALTGLLLLTRRPAGFEAATASQNSNVPSKTDSVNVSLPKQQEGVSGEIVATIDDKIITWADWQQATRLDAAMSRVTNQAVPTAEETLDRLISETIILGEATDVAAPSGAEVEERIAAFEKSWDVTDQVMVSALADADLTRADLVARVARLILVETTLNQLTAQENDLRQWLAEARASAKISLYRSLLASTKTQPPSLLQESGTLLSVKPNAIEADSPRQENEPSTLPADLTVAPYPDYVAPDFTLPQLTGSSLSLSDFRGKPTLIHFWASWCSPCRQELATLQSTYNTNGDTIGLVAINVKEPADTVAAFVTETGLTFPVALDPAGQISDAAYQIRGVPTTIIVDANGVVTARHVGPLTEATIEQYLIPLQKQPLEEATARHAPDFNLIAASGESVSLQDYRDQNNVVLVFYRGQT